MMMVGVEGRRVETELQKLISFVHGRICEEEKKFPGFS